MIIPAEESFKKIINIFGNKTSVRFFIVFILFEILSFLGYLFPALREALFFLIAIAAVILSLKNLKYGLFLALAELLIGGKGYLFYFEQGGTIISLRIALFLAVMAVWLFITAKKLIASRGRILAKYRVWGKTSLPYFAVLLAFCAWGAINGLLSQNGFANAFLDLNGWLYLFLVFPAYQIFLKDKKAASMLAPIFAAGLGALALKTFFLEYIFSHKIFFILEPVYRWVRTSGVGEITIMESGFVRVFLQSQIFALFAFFILIFMLDKFAFSRKTFSQKNERTASLIFFFSLTLIISMILISFSRSFWVACAAVFALYLVLALARKGIKKNLPALAVISVAAIVSFLLITLVIKFPYPKPGDVRFTDAFGERATELSGEAAVSSRQELWPKLLAEIEKAPILGKGFGATVTYKTGDPRVLASSADGLYTTYAFEWGWLDIWLKLGLFGALFYLFLIFKLAWKGLKDGPLSSALALGLILFAVVNFFTPYANHPLGIGFLITAAALIEMGKNDKNKIKTELS